MLEKAVRSALHQTLSPIEVLVCDDGSSDNSRAIIEAIGDRRVRWLGGPRGGRPAIPRNRGIRESRGDWLAFLDDDDEWLPEKLERQLALAKKLGCLATCTNARRYVPNRGDLGCYLSWKEERITFDSLLKDNQVVCSSAMVRKSLFESVYGFPEDAQLKAVEDYALWLRIASKTDFGFDADSLVIYRDDTTNSIRKGEEDVWRQRQAVFSDFLIWSEASTNGQHYAVNIRRRMFRDSVARFSIRLKTHIKRIIRVFS